MIFLTLVLVMISTLGIVAGDSHGTGWTKITTDQLVPIDFEKSKLEVYLTINAQNVYDWGFKFVDDSERAVSGWQHQGTGRLNGRWRFLNCNDANNIAMKAEDFEGTKTWSFTKKNGLLSLMVDGKELIAGKAPGQADTKCDSQFPNWKSDWEKEVKGVKFLRAYGPSPEYRIVSDQDNNGGNNNSDRKKMSGSSKSCLNNSVLVSAFVAYLRF